MSSRLPQSGSARLIALFLVCLFPVLESVAQQIAVANYSTDDGLAHPQVWSVFQDSRGYLWIGTTDGVNRYDGTEFTRITVRDGLRNQTVRTILEDPRGHLWFGTDNGLSSYDGKRVRPWDSRQGAPEGTIWGSARDLTGRLWFATQYHGVVRFDGSFQTFGTPQGLASPYAYSIHADRAGNLWVGHRGAGITKCSITSEGSLADCRVLGSDQLPNLEVHSIVEDRRGAIWAATRGGGVVRIDVNGSETFTTANGIAQDDLYSLAISPVDELVLGTVGEGVNVCGLPDLSSCRSIGVRQGLADNGVLSVAFDRSNDLWVGMENGLSRIANEQLISFTERSGLPHHTVYAVEPAGPGRVWLGTLGGLAEVRESGGETVINSWDGSVLPGEEVWDLERDSAGRLWVATNGGLCLFENGRCTRVIDQSSGLSSSDLITLGSSRDGRLFVTSLDGVSIVNPLGPDPEIRNITLQEGLSGSVPYGVAEDRLGRLWLGTDRGLSVVDGGEIRSYTRDDGLPVDDISALIADESGKIWIGSNGGGLVAFDPPASLTETDPSFQTWGLENGVPEAVAALELRRDGLIWLGTNDGVYLFDPENGRARLAFDKDSGLIGNEVNVLKRDDSGRLWTGVVGGVTVWNPVVQEPPAPPPMVRIEELRAFSGHRWRQPYTRLIRDAPADTVSWLGEGIPELTHEQNSLRIDYRALTFRERGRLRFQTMLEGFDRDWTEPTTEAFKEFTNLDHGDYRFLVRAAVREGAWGEPASVAFSIAPAWWQSAWFAILATLGTLTLLTLGYRARTFRINRRNRELEAAVDERTDDLRRYARALEEHSRALDRANERIRRADRIKSEFLTNMSHELRTPLNAIIGFSEVLGTRLEDRVDKREATFLDNIQSSGRYLLMMINNLLDLSKIEAGRMQLDLEAIYVPAVIQEICNVVRGYATQKGVDIETRFEPAVQSVETDIAKLEQVVINLISNAVKFSPQGASVVVEIREHDDEHWALSVTDRGPGIREEDLGHIFDEFSQARGSAPHPGGTGLGLALVRRFVDILGGQISVDSTEGEGSRFTVILPRKPKSGDPERTEGGDHRAKAGILLAGTNAQLSGCVELLEREGFTPVHAHDLHEMVRYAREIRPAAAIIAIDLYTPETWTRFSHFREELHDLEVGLIVCFFMGNRLVSAFGADDWIPLPARIDDLSRSIGLHANPGSKQTVVIVSNRPFVLDLIDRALPEVETSLIRQSADTTALPIIQDEENTCFLIDLCSEHTKAFDLIHRIEHDRKTRHVPMIVVADASPEESWFRTIRERPSARGVTWEDLILLTHEIVRRRSGRMVRRASGLFD